MEELKILGKDSGKHIVETPTGRYHLDDKQLEQVKGGADVNDVCKPEPVKSVATTAMRIETLEARVSALEAASRPTKEMKPSETKEVKSAPETK